MITHIAPPAFLSDRALTRVLHTLPRARLVGGCVRDAIVGLPPSDIDLATPDPPEDVLAALYGAGLRAVLTGMAHGTITAVSFGRSFEITTLRRDVHTDGRHAMVAYTDDWQQDAARRDFTINALSMTPAGEIFDFFSGVDDLRTGRLRFVGDPAIRLAEDRLRVLRFFRFFARYAARPPDQATQVALHAAAAELGALSAERVWAELKRILAAPDPRAALILMRALGVLAAVLPEAADDGGLERLIDAGAPPDPLLRVAALVEGNTRQLAARLRLSRAEAERLAELKSEPVPLEHASDDELRRLLAETPAKMLIDRVQLSGGPAVLCRRLDAVRPPVFPLKGRDALAIGMAPGPCIGKALRAVRAWWIAGGCRADRAACLGRLGRMRGCW